LNSELGNRNSELYPVVATLAVDIYVVTTLAVDI